MKYANCFCDAVAISTGSKVIQPKIELLMNLQDNKSLSDEELSEIKARYDQATPEPWKAFIEVRDGFSGSDFIQTGGEDIYLNVGTSVSDYEFIAHAHQDIPQLIAEIERLRKILHDIEDKS